MFIKVVSLLFCSLLVINNASAKAPGNENVKKCVSGLKAFETEIKKHRPALDSDLARGLSGWVMLNSPALSKKELDEIRSSKGSTNDVAYCTSSLVDQKALNVLIKAFHGYFSENPFNDLARCQVAILSIGFYLEQKLGKEKTAKISFAIGREVGEVTASINILYKNQNFTNEELDTESYTQLKALSDKNQQEREVLINEYTNTCEWYGIPLKGIMEGVSTSNDIK